MDALTNLSRKDYASLSRYSPFDIAYNTNDEKYVYCLTNQLDTSTTYISHTVQQYDTLDSLSLKYYGRPDYFWIIADYNRIQDPFIKLKGNFTTIKIPSLGQIKYE